MIRNKYLLLFVLSLLKVTNIFSQYNFQHLIGGHDHERAQTIFSTFDNGFIVNGASYSFGVGDVDATLIKTDNQGNVLWSKAYGTTVYDNSEYAIETFDHNIVCCGRSNIVAGQPTSAIIFKTDSSGQLLWTKKYGGIGDDDLVEIIETADHGYAAVGFTKSLTTGSSDILFIRTDINGDTLYTRSFGTIEKEEGLSIIQRFNQESFLITGRQITYPGGNEVSDGILLRTNASGNIIWSKLYGGSNWEELTAVKQVGNVNYILSGSTGSFSIGAYDILLMETDTLGNVFWSKTFGGTKTEAAYDIYVNPDNSYVLSGYTESLGSGHSRGDDSSNVFLMKTDENGVLQWMEVYGDGLQDEAFRSNKASDGGYVIPGFTTNYLFNDSTQMYFIKTDSMGLTGCHEESVTPFDSSITMPFQTINMITLSGLPINTFTLTQTSFTPDNDDACLFASTHSSIEVENNLKVFPNPFNNYIQISFDENNSSQNELKVYDVCGKIIKSIKTNSSPYLLNMEDLESGVYYISVNSYDKPGNGILIFKN